MTIEWDDDAIRRITQEAGKKALGASRRAASGARCPDHGPIEVTGPDPTTGEFGFKRCCDKGERAARSAISRALR